MTSLSGVHYGVTVTSPDVVLDTPRNAVLRATIDRPDVRGAYRSQTCRELIAALETFATDDSLCALVLTGTPGSFCSGGDLTAAEDLEASHARRLGHGVLLREGIHRVLRTLDGLDKPVIAVVDGPAIAGGLSLALACTIRISSPRAKFGDVSTSVGLLPDDGGAWLFPRAMGLDRAARMTLLGEVYDAEQALALGLVTEIAEDASARGLALAEQIASRAPLTTRTALSLMKDALRSDLDTSLRSAERAVEFINTSADVAEGLAAFAERRPPRFTGR